MCARRGQFLPRVARQRNFEMNPPADKREPWLLALRQRSVWLRALKFGLSVGLLQAAVNQGDAWLHHDTNLRVVAKTVASPLISFALVLFTSAATWAQKSVKQNEAVSSKQYE